MTRQDLVSSAPQADDLTVLSAALPYAPLPMPKQVLERKPGYWLRFLVRWPGVKTATGL
ncbi:hypothetical protein [Pseudogemmobacter sp. W21_MBD1_M6]|uniref:hypothetical protein n=1 Tax=Pseudogemmobacter sp. W21_MBD1_M6 TaxID=3240271 RepID=UPI003F9E4790